MLKSHLMNSLFCPVFRMKRANSLNVLNVGVRESQDGSEVSRLLTTQSENQKSASISCTFKINVTS